MNKLIQEFLEMEHPEKLTDSEIELLLTVLETLK